MAEHDDDPTATATFTANSEGKEVAKGSGRGSDDTAATAAATASSSAGRTARECGINDGGDDDQQQMSIESLLRTLERLEVTVSQLDDKFSAPQRHLSHYRRMPPAVQHAYSQLLSQGAQLVKAASTKYTLMEKILLKQQQQQKESSTTVANNKMGRELLQGCQLVATGCVVLCDDETGCALAVRKSAKRAGRAVLRTTAQLVQSLLELEKQQQQQLHKDGGTTSPVGDQQQQHAQVPAQRTGAVWQACDALIEENRVVPQGNRNAMRRDWFTYAKECNETADEFQALVDLGPALREENEDEEEEDKAAAADEGDGEDGDGEADDKEAALWEAFLNDASSDAMQYTSEELPVAKACVGIVKCSRGCMNVVLKACEDVGRNLICESSESSEAAGDESNSTKRPLSDDDKTRLLWIRHVYDSSREVGVGMTDLGAMLYPPLYDKNRKKKEGVVLAPLQKQIHMQLDAIDALLAYVLTGRGVTYDGSDAGAAENDSKVILDLGEEVLELAAKVQAGAQSRREEADAAVAALRESLESGA